MEIESKLKLIEKLLKWKKDFNYFFNLYFPPKSIDIIELKKNWEKLIDWWIKDDLINFYVHTPFCVERCKFCQYHWFKIEKENSLDSYIEYLEQYLLYFSDLFKDIKFWGLYFWWWTPSIYNEKQLDRLLNAIFSNIKFSWKFYKEFELNPLTTTFGKLDILKKYWFNRLTFWVQSFNKNTLEKEGRNYCSPEHFKKIVDYAKKLWFLEINADIIIWLWDEKKEDVFYTLEKMFEVEPYSILIYTLQENKERSSLYWKNEWEFYENVRVIHDYLFDNLIKKSKYSDSLKENDYNINTWVKIRLNWYKEHKLVQYETHNNSLESTFWIWFWAYSNIFWYWKYYIPDNIYKLDKLSFLFQKTNIEDERNILLCRAVQLWIIDNKFFTQNFNYNIIEEHKDVINYLKANNKIKINWNNIFFNTINIKETYTYWLLFFDIKFIIKLSLYIDKDFKK